MALLGALDCCCFVLPFIPLEANEVYSDVFTHSARQLSQFGDVISGSPSGQSKGHLIVSNLNTPQAYFVSFADFESMAWIIVLLLQGTFAVRDFLSPPYMIQPIPTTGPIYFENSVEEKTSPPECTAIEQQKIRQCADPLYAIGAITDEGDILSFSWNHFVSRTQDYFGQVCDNFYVFDMCIDPYKELCFSKDPVRERYQTAISVLDFLCRDGYTEMVRNFECFTQTLTRAEMMQCQAELIADTRKIPPEVEVGHTGQQAAVCGAVRNYIDCVKYPIRYECGYRAWYLVKEIIVRPTATLLPQCDVTSLGVVDRTYTITMLVILIACFL